MFLVVFRSGVAKLTMVALDATHKAQVSRENAARLRATPARPGFSQSGATPPKGRRRESSSRFSGMGRQASA